MKMGAQREISMKQLKLFTLVFLMVSSQIIGETGKYTKNLEVALPGFQIPEAWMTNHEPFRVIGNLYGVGGQDLSVFLITSDEGHILVNTAVEGSIKDISANIDSLGFSINDVKVLLSMQSHFDHTADLALIKELTGAKMYATKKDAPILEDGGVSDPHFGGVETFRPIKVDKIIKDGEIISVGSTKLKVHYHPGHTEGSSSYSMQVEESGKVYDVLIANMGTINPGKKMIVDPTYEGVSEDFAFTYKDQKMMNVDIWVAAHKSHYGFYDKYQPNQTYDPETFLDPDGYLDAIEALEIVYIKLVNVELKQKNDQ